MTYDVRPTASALADALAIGDRVRAARCPDNADRWLRALMSALKGHAEYPRRCPRAPENDAVAAFEIRNLIFGDYRVLFSIIDRRVFVLHIRHCRRRQATPGELVVAMDQVGRMRRLRR